jgi:hypothetical protein
MSMLNKFVAPELKIAKKTAKGGKGSKAKVKSHAAFRPSVTAAGKSGLTVSSRGGALGLDGGGAPASGGGGKK